MWLPDQAATAARGAQALAERGEAVPDAGRHLPAGGANDQSVAFQGAQGLGEHLLGEHLLADAADPAL
jgi:hypothetical protein